MQNFFNNTQKLEASSTLSAQPLWQLTNKVESHQEVSRKKGG